MKFKYLLMSLGILLLFSGYSEGQDLIERTQLGVSVDFSRTNPSMAYHESQSLKHAGTYQVVNPFDLAPEFRKSEVSEFIEGHVMLDLPAGTIPRLMASMRDGIDLRIPVAQDKEIELDLVEVFPLSGDFIGETSEGEIITTKDYPVRFYRGAIKGVPNSFAAITIADGMFRGLIGDDYGNYVLAELDGSDDRFVLYNDRKLKMEFDIECGVQDESPYDEDQQELLQVPHKVVDHERGDDCVEIYVEMEEDFYDDWNNVTSATNFIYALFNENATLYNNENISVALKKIKIWTTVDPYTETGACAQRTDFADEIQNNYEGRLAHLISSRAIGGGCAFIDELCSTYSASGDRGPYQFSGSMNTSVTGFPTYSWNVMVFVHEMGHTFGSRHTHACVWNGNNTAIDGCGPAHGYPTEGGCAAPPVPAGGGTIMSYCHLDPVGINFNLGFGTQPGNLIRNEVATGSCLLDCSSIANCPLEIYLDGNIDADTYYAEEKIEVSGTVLNATTVNTRCEETIYLDPGFRVNTGGVFSADFATCTAALQGKPDNSSSAPDPSGQTKVEQKNK